MIRQPSDAAQPMIKIISEPHKNGQRQSAFHHGLAGSIWDILGPSFHQAMPKMVPEIQNPCCQMSINCRKKP